MLHKLFTNPGELQRVEDQLVEMIDQKKAFYTENSEKRRLQEKDYKPTRRDRRAEREMQKLKEKISLAG